MAKEPFFLREKENLKEFGVMEYLLMENIHFLMDWHLKKKRTKHGIIVMTLTEDFTPKLFKEFNPLHLLNLQTTIKYLQCQLVHMILEKVISIPRMVLFMDTMVLEKGSQRKKKSNGLFNIVEKQCKYYFCCKIHSFVQIS